MEEWVLFIENCAENEENEVLRINVAQVIGSGNVDFILAQPFNLCGKVYCVRSWYYCHLYFFYLSNIHCRILTENITFRVWKVIINLLMDDSVEVKVSMASGLSNIMQSLGKGNRSKQIQ